MPKIYTREGLLDTPAMGGSVPSVTLGEKSRMDEAIRNRKYLKNPAGDPANTNIGGKSFKRGGRVQKTGVYNVHRGEKVVKAFATPKGAIRKGAKTAKKPAQRTRRR